MSILKYPDDNANIPKIQFTAYGYKYISITEFESGNMTSIEKEERLTSIVLYLPRLEESINNNYNAKSVATYGLNGGEVKQAVLDISRTAKNLIVSKIPALEAVKVKEGEDILPNEILVYENTSNMSLSFTFKLIPRNEKEAGTIKNIIKDFKLYSLPSLKDASNDVSLIFSFPAVWEIDIFPGGQSGSISSENDGLIYNYRYMALQNVQVSYTEGSENFLVYKDGTPIGISLSLSFMSLYPPFKKDNKVII